MKIRNISLSFLALCMTLFSGNVTAVRAASMTIVADGLDQTRGFNFAPDGTLYIPEPGVGGDTNKCQPSPSTLFQPICAGTSSKITAISPDGSKRTLLDGFSSLAEQPSKNQGAGLADIDFDSEGNAYIISGFAGYPGNRDKDISVIAQDFPVPDGQKATFPPSPIEDVLETPDLAKLFKIDLETEEYTEVFDFGLYEITQNPDGGDYVTNPYDLDIANGKAYVVDGGGNATYEIDLASGEGKATALPRLIVENPEFPPQNPPEELEPEVNPLGNGEVIEEAVDGNPPAPGGPSTPPEGTPPGAPPEGTPPGAPPEGGEGPGDLLPGLFEPVPGNPNAISIQSVPTGNAIGPDGAVYVGEYTGFPYPEGQARIFKLKEDGTPEIYAEGFTQITDIEFDADGNLLVLEFSDEAPWKGEDIRSLPSSLTSISPDGKKTVLVAPGEGLESADGITIGPDGSIFIANKAIGGGEGQIVRLDLIRDIGEDEPKSVPEPGSVLGLMLAGAGGISVLKKKQQ